MSRRAWLRAGLLVLAAPQLLVGVWALADPTGFFDGFPAAGHAWVRLLPPYNEHLVRDVGALNLALTAVLVAAMVAPQKALLRAALVAQLVYAVPHAVFHMTHLAGFPLADAAAQTAGFAVQVVLPLVLLLSEGRRPGTRPRPRAVRPPSPSPSAPSA